MCRNYVVRECRTLTRVRVVVALGKVAFDQYLKTCRMGGYPTVRPSPRFSHGVVVPLPWGVTLLGSYHPSQQNTFTGRLTRPMFHAVFRKATALLEKAARR